MIDLKYMVINNLRDEEIALHFHSSYELTYYLSGAGYCEYQKEPLFAAVPPDGEETTHYILPSVAPLPRTRFYFKKGSMILFPPDIAHYKKHTEPSRFLSLVFDISDSAFIPKHIHYTNVMGRNTFLFSEMEQEYYNKKANYLKMIECLLSQVFIEFTRNETLGNGVDDFIRQSIRYIDDYFLTAIDFELYCRTNGYSLDYFRHKFKEFSEYSPKAYLLKKRLDYASHLLRFTDLSIREISEICKFGDYMHFSVYFSKKYGVSPSSYRKQKRDENES